MSRKLLIGIAFFNIFLATAGCTGSPMEDLSIQETVTVTISPAARYTHLAVVTCASTIDQANFEISEAVPSQATANLLIQLGEPAQVPPFAAQIAVEELAIVIHGNNPVGSLTLDEVQKLFNGTIQDWSELGGADGAVQVWSLLEADETRQLFIQQVLNHGLFTTNAYLAPSPEIMVTAIEGNQFAIGFLPKSWSSPNLVSILPGVSFPVLVLADAPLRGASEELVTCLQGDLGQEVLTAFYAN